MDRREFLRRVVFASVFGAIGVIGIAELTDKVISESNPSTPSIPQLINASTTTVIATETSGISSQSPNTSSQGGTTTQQSSNNQSSPSGFVLVAPLSALNGKTSAYFNHPTYGLSILVNYSNSWRAFSAICTHAGCNVNFTGSSLFCPCHSGYFSALDGSVQSGPPPTPLREFTVTIQGQNLYVSLI